MSSSLDTPSGGDAIAKWKVKGTDGRTAGRGGVRRKKGAEKVAVCSAPRLIAAAAAAAAALKPLISDDRESREGANVSPPPFDRGPAQLSGLCPARKSPGPVAATASEKERIKGDQLKRPTIYDSRKMQFMQITRVLSCVETMKQNKRLSWLSSISHSCTPRSVAVGR